MTVEKVLFIISDRLSCVTVCHFFKYDKKQQMKKAAIRLRYYILWDKEMNEMPTERFYRLSEAKKRAIREAAKKEFTRVPYEKASINQIIQNAEISRGSFYTYFEDKRDVLKYLFEESCEKLKHVCEEKMEKSHGDYLLVLEMMFEHFVGKLQETKEMMDFFRNVFSSTENMSLLGLDGMPSPEKPLEEGSPVRQVYREIDRSLLRYDDLDTVTALVSMGGMALMFAIRQYYDYPEQLERIRANFYRSVQLLRCGAYRNN